MDLVLSVFPGIDLLGRGFEAEGYCIVRGPDTLWAGDVREFNPPAGKFEGVIGGTPCQEFSGKRRLPPTGAGLAMLAEFARVVTEAAPAWWLMENVPHVPDVQVPGYTVQRFDLQARECGLSQSRLRHFQFGSREGLVIVPERVQPAGPAAKIALASEGQSTARRGWAEFCALQGLEPLELPGMSIAARYRAVGNGVPIPMARVVARAIRDRRALTADASLCLCGCGRLLHGHQAMAKPACRKRMQRRRDMAISVTARCVTPPRGIEYLSQTSGRTPESRPAVTVRSAPTLGQAQPDAVTRRSPALAGWSHVTGPGREYCAASRVTALSSAGHVRSR